MNRDRLDEHRRIWQTKPVLRRLYEDFYRRIISACVPGRTLEIGGGSGNLKERMPDVISTDILTKPWLDVVADAQALPFSGASLSNIVCVDVLHHIERPRRFLAEASRTLRPGGRLVMLEPAITPVSWVFYKLLHPEPVVLGVDPLEDGEPSARRHPFDANQAIPTLLFGRDCAKLRRYFPELRLLRREYLSLAAYPLSGGFQSWSMIPACMVPTMIRLEDRLIPIVGRFMGFRLLAVVERTEKRGACGTQNGVH